MANKYKVVKMDSHKFFSLAAMEIILFIYIALQANGGPDHYLYRVIPGYIAIQVLFFYGVYDNVTKNIRYVRKKK